jgi:CRISPR-associated protein Cas5t
MEALHITFEAFTATFKVPFINTGTGTVISAPVPSYSNIVGLISCCAGRYIDKDETLIGFKYMYSGKGRDIETTRRLELDNKGRLKRNPKLSIATREFHVNPRLDLYLSNTEFERYFKSPIGVPTLGRSQDIAWITNIERVEIEKVPGGRIKPTLIPFPCTQIGGRLIRYCDYYINDATGYLRQPDAMILYQVVPETEDGVYITRDNLYRLDNTDEVIYMHALGDKR